MAVVHIFLTYFLAPLGLAGVLLRAIRPEKEDRWRWALIGAGLGPAAIAWLLWLALLSVPGLDWWVYVTLISTALIGLVVWTRHEIDAILRSIMGFWRMPRAGLHFRPILLLWIVLAVMVGLVVAQIMLLPLLAHDPLEYHLVAGEIYKVRSLAIYPIDVARPDSGLFANSTHPPAFHLLLVWAFIFEGTDHTIGLARLINLFFFVLLLAVLSLSLRRFGKNFAAFGVLLVLATPVYISQVTAHHIDAFRIFLFFSAFLLLGELIRRPNPGIMVTTGVVTGLSMFAHSIGALTPVFVLAIYFAIGPGLLIERTKVIFVVGGLASVVGGGHYMWNILQYGVPFHDSNPILELPVIEFDTYLRYSRTLATFDQRIFNGVLAPFDAWRFGFSFWIPLILFPIFTRAFLKDDEVRILLIVPALYFLLALVTSQLGIDTMIKNVRYPMTLLPFAAYLGALGMGRIYEMVERPRATG